MTAALAEDAILPLGTNVSTDLVTKVPARARRQCPHNTSHAEQRTRGLTARIRQNYFQSSACFFLRLQGINPINPLPNSNIIGGSGDCWIEPNRPAV